MYRTQKCRVELGDLPGQFQKIEENVDEGPKWFTPPNSPSTDINPILFEAGRVYLRPPPTYQLPAVHPWFR